MILKLNMKHQGMEVYKLCINHDPGLTLTYCMARSTLVAHAFTPGVILTLPWGYIDAYYNCSQTRVYEYISQVSGERL